MNSTTFGHPPAEAAPHVLIIDDSDEFRELLQHDPKARVIVLSGGGTYNDVNVLQPAVLMGARKMLYKPVTLTDLHSAISETIAQSQQEQAQTTRANGN